MSAADVAIARRWQRKQQAAGFCIKCPAPRINSQHCVKHAQAQRDYMRKIRAAGARCCNCTRRLSTEEINKGYRRCQACVAAAEAKRVTRNARIVELRGEGNTTREISSLVGVSETQVRAALQAAAVSGYAKEDDEPEAKDTAPRCPRCWLLLPHAGCIGRVDTYARRSSWMVGL